MEGIKVFFRREQGTIGVPLLYIMSLCCIVADIVPRMYALPDNKVIELMMHLKATRN